jgi:hypothetical protein
MTKVTNYSTPGLSGSNQVASETRLSPHPPSVTLATTQTSILVPNPCISGTQAQTLQTQGDMIRQDFNRVDPKRRNVVDYRKKQFAAPSYKEAQYPYRLNYYATPPTADITLEQFEQWAIDRLRSMA